MSKTGKGDTLVRVAQRNHASIKAICKKNGIKQNKVLRPGQKLNPDYALEITKGNSKILA